MSAKPYHQASAGETETKNFCKKTICHLKSMPLELDALPLGLEKARY
jgi:hypothetical protein